MSKRDQSPTREQVEIARWTASLGAITADALAIRQGTSTASARGQLAAMRSRGMLLRHRPLADRPSLFTITRAGLRACGERGIEVCRVSPSSASHLIACAAVAGALERCYPGHRVAGERELRREEREHGRPLASAQLGACRAGETRLHCPDMVIWPDGSNTELPVSVEVELTVKAPRRLLEICRGWARCRTVDGVLYIAPDNVRRALSRAVREARACERIAVVAFDQLPGMEALAGELGRAER
jgi:hypothetical protein